MWIYTVKANQAIMRQVPIPRPFEMAVYRLCCAPGKTLRVQKACNAHREQVDCEVAVVVDGGPRGHRGGTNLRQLQHCAHVRGDHRDCEAAPRRRGRRGRAADLELLRQLQGKDRTTT